MLNILKLCVGCPTPQLLEDWQASRPDPIYHTTRMWPKREAEIVGIGSIYWVMGGEIRARQPIQRFDEVIGDDGIRRCKMVFERGLILVRPTPKRPFQGWRYLNPEDAPTDIGTLDDSDLPENIAAELSLFGVS